MKILFTNNTLKERAGTELFVRDLAKALLRKGHEVAAFSSKLGEVAEEMRHAGMLVCAGLEEMPWTPDIIHGHHHLDFMAALLRFRETPAVFVSHGWVPWVEIPPRHPRILKYYAVDHPTRVRAARALAREIDEVSVLPNFVDLERFVVRSPLPERPKRALVLSNYTAKHLPVVRAACAAHRIDVEACGRDSGEIVPRPEEILPHYDIVFAKGRSALEAVATGNAVVLCDRVGVGPMVSLQNALQLRSLELDFDEWCRPLTIANVDDAITHYSATDAAAVTKLARSLIGLEPASAQLVADYEECIGRFAASPRDVTGEARAESDYLQWLARELKNDSATLRALDVTDDELLSAAPAHVPDHPRRRRRRSLFWRRALS
ncbi:MAG: hypothetical protein M3R59_09010 [Verrucomicrobiota bacterium]|nr:hypothetical protein [Verrucomicrobiota bacterium]